MVFAAEVVFGDLAELSVFLGRTVFPSFVRSTLSISASSAISNSSSSPPDGERCRQRSRASSSFSRAALPMVSVTA